ncbi:hypothetical protein PGT21_029004 [Puccinia graminis f. sp. tritici]|uniref:Uncharacterized protein n=1 Tax=Puccinia graminis f. sp. tritici TaxID=56615 RepID=A0A5B0NZI8_PUCGR|nr:hypothetical protein PGT21_029004 [Puccinia graminis f. sp. tritici]KAA1121567.1 hypothetical protein PGTUg99_032392 [Puccinia graminis f. sp. tritici]
MLRRLTDWINQTAHFNHEFVAGCLWSISGSATGTEACPWKTPSRSPVLTHCPALATARSATQPRSGTGNLRRSVRRGEEPQPNTVSPPSPNNSSSSLILDPTAIPFLPYRP